MVITELSRTQGMEFVDLTSEVDPLTIEVGGFTKVTEVKTVDFCIAATYEITVVAEAESLSAIVCQAEDTYVFTVTPPPPTPSPTTPAPVVVETGSPSGVPSDVPSDVPTPVPETLPPTLPPVIPPTPPPTPPPVVPPTEAPVVPPIPPPTPPPVVPPTEAPVVPPIPPPTPPPVVPPTEAPVIPPTPPPVVPPTEAPVVPPTPPPTPATPPPTAAPTVKPPTGIDDNCFTQVAVECLPPVDPADPDGGTFEDCNSINVAPAECAEFVSVLTFRFNGGDCLDSNNIQDPRVYSCEDFFEGPPAADDVGAEAYMQITDIKGEGIVYFDGVIAVGDVFNITNILPNTVIIANVNVTIYDGEPAPENIRETMIIHTSCSQVTFLKDRYGVLELIGFLNPSQGYQQCLIPVTFTFTISSVLELVDGEDVVVESLTVVTNFDPPNQFLNFTDDVVGTPLEPGGELEVLSEDITIDLSIRKSYIATAIVQGVLPDGFSCRSSGSANFTAGVIDTRPTPSPASA